MVVVTMISLWGLEVGIDLSYSSLSCENIVEGCLYGRRKETGEQEEKSPLSTSSLPLRSEEDEPTVLALSCV